MARRSARPQPDRTLELPTLTRTCPACGGPPWSAYVTRPAVPTLHPALPPHPPRPRFRPPPRPEEEGPCAFREPKSGPEDPPLGGPLPHPPHPTRPEFQPEWTRRGVAACLRTVTNLLDRYDELLALSL